MYFLDSLSNKSRDNGGNLDQMQIPSFLFEPTELRLDQHIIRLRAERGRLLDYSGLDDTSLLMIIAEKFGARSSDPGLNAAVEALYDRYGRLVYSVALHVTGEEQVAEEITQDVFVRACESARSYRPNLAKVSTWLVSITRHRAIDELRRRQSRPEHERADWPEDVGLEIADGLPVMDGLEADVETNLEAHAVRQLIAGLPQDQRQVLRLAFFKGMSHSEIAGVLDEPLGTVKSRIRLAMEKLRDGLRERGVVGG